MIMTRPGRESPSDDSARRIMMPCQCAGDPMIIRRVDPGLRAISANCNGHRDRDGPGPGPGFHENGPIPKNLSTPFCERYIEKYKITGDDYCGPNQKKKIQTGVLDWRWQHWQGGLALWQS